MTQPTSTNATLNHMNMVEEKLQLVKQLILEDALEGEYMSVEEALDYANIIYDARHKQTVHNTIMTDDGPIF